jgi:hypothetical protein
MKVEVSEKLRRGVSWSSLQELIIVEHSDSVLEFGSHKEYGPYLSWKKMTKLAGLTIPGFIANFYPGNSIKSTLKFDESLELFIQDNLERVVFRVFEDNNGKMFHRIYLRKINSVKQN